MKDMQLHPTSRSQVESLDTDGCQNRLSSHKEYLVSRGVTIHVPLDSIQFRLLPFGFDYFDSIIQNINDF